MMTSSAIIMTLVTRSRPFCRPLAQTRMPNATTKTIQNAITPGSASISLKAFVTCPVLRPDSFPAAVM